MVEREGMSAFVEVKRYRSKEGESIPESLGPHGTLQKYGNPGLAQARIAKDLLDKIRQIEPLNGIEHGIIALWSDRVFFEDVEFECAVRQISPEAGQKGLVFCIFGSHDVDVGRQQCFYCEPVGLVGASFQSWMQDLRGAGN
jgi:hypothetical protein